MQFESILGNFLLVGFCTSLAKAAGSSWPGTDNWSNTSEKIIHSDTFEMITDQIQILNNNTFRYIWNDNAFEMIIDQIHTYTVPEIHPKR